MILASAFRRCASAFCAALLLAFSSPPSSAQVVITEFMAANSATIDDEDGDSSDWIELFNPSASEVNLDGWFLTDDAADLTGWRLPAVTLGPGAFVLIFASEKNRSLPGSPLHTNFKLSSGGDYLALVEPDGATIAAEFGVGEFFPEQFEDFSYGLEQTGTTTNVTFVQDGDTCRILVPTAGLGLTWTEPSFSDASWGTAATGVGYENGSGYQALFGAGGDVGALASGINTTVYVRIPFQVTDPSSVASLILKMKYDDGFVAYLNGTRVADSNAPSTPDWNSASSADNPDANALVFEEFDITAYASLLTTGTNVLAIHGLNGDLGSSDLLVLPELQAVRLTNPSLGGPGYLATPSPGTFNGDTFGGFVGDTNFSFDRGFYDDPISVEITSATPDATIRFTTDGSDPSETEGTLYIGPINVTATTTLKAIAYKSGLVSTNVDTQTYLFPADIIQQSEVVPPGWPADGAVNGHDMNYGMDPDIVGSRHAEQEVIDALMDIPTFSIVTPVENLVDGSSGIYVNPGGDGRQWERPASIELIHPDGQEGFQINGGIRIRGGFSRSTSNPKHAFRLFFRRAYGSAKLKYPLFDDEGVDEFDNVDLRTTQNYSWSFQNDNRNSFMRDVWSRDTQRDMGRPYTRSRYYHLYLNGLYWGVYQTQERAEASYAESYFGGDQADYDVIKSFGNVTDGSRDAHTRLWQETTNGLGADDAYYRVQGLNPDGTSNPAFEKLLDVDNLIDYMIITYYTGDRDGPGSRFTQPNPNNFYTIYNRNNPDGFKYFEHDSEHSMGTGDNDMTFPFTTGSSSTQFNPHWLHEQIVANPIYVRRFGDRVQEVLFNGGCLTAEKGIARIDARAAVIDQAMIAESARWGDSKRATPYTRDDWLNAVNGVRSFVNSRKGIFLGQLRARGWFPGFDAPSLNQHGGEITSDFDVFFSASQGTIYYTTDGSDPRTPDGSVSASALIAQPSGEQITVLLDQGGAASALVAEDGALGDTWQALAFNDSAWLSGTTGIGYDNNADYLPLIGLNVDAQMNGINGSVYVRVPFNVADPGAFTGLTLRMKYDDGFVAYLNGVRVAAANQPGSLSWNSTATGNHDDSLAQQFVEFPIDQHLGLLQQGNNILAIHGLNTDLGSSDMIIVPRLEGSILSGGTAVNLSTGLQRVRTRARSGNEWSALTEASFLVDIDAADAGNLVISKLMYNPSSPSQTEFDAGFTQANQFEFIELLNVGTRTVDLSGTRFTDGVDYTFPEALLLGPGERIVIMSDRAAFEFRYGAGLNLAGEFASGNLDNGGEQIVLINAEGQVILDFRYEDEAGWPVDADGNGYALVLLSPETAGDLGDPASWRQSALPGGSPAMDDRVRLADWRAAHFSPQELGDASVSGDLADPDGDGFVNLAELILGSDPRDLASRGHQRVVVVENGGVNYPAIEFRKAIAFEDADTVVEYSDQLLGWGGATAAFDSFSNGDGTATLIWRATSPISLAGTGYFRLRLSLTSP